MLRTIQYLHRCLRTIQYLHRCLKTKDLCVENNTIFTQMLEKKRPFVLRTRQYLHRCFKTKDPLCRDQYNIYTLLKLSLNRPFPSTNLALFMCSFFMVPHIWYVSPLCPFFCIFRGCSIP